MTPPEDDAARLARKLAECVVDKPIVSRVAMSPYECVRMVEWEREVERVRLRISIGLGNYLAERDARERMAMERIKSLLATDDPATIGESCYQQAVRDVLGIIDAALSAKSDEQ